MMRLIPGLLVGFALLAFASSKIIHVQTLSRHCDRTPYPTEILPNNPVDWLKEYGLDYGQLTPRGMNQCYQLGQGIKERYFSDASPNKIFEVSKKFQSLEHKITSTSVHRTIISAWSLSMGLFSETGPMIGDQPALPGKVDPIPTHTFDDINDVILGATQTCTKISKNIIARRTDPEFLEMGKPYADLIKKTVELTGYKKPVDWANFHTFFDLINVQNDNGRLDIPFIKDNFQKIKEASEKSQFGLYTRNTFGYLGGGSIVNEVLTGMKTFINQREKIAKMGMEAYLNEIEQQKPKELDPLAFLQQSGQEKYSTGKLGAAYIPKYKYIHWSAHDSTVIAVLHALKLIDDYPENAINPPYGSCLAFELHENENPKDGEEKYFIRILYKKGYDQPWTPHQFKTLGKTVKGCANDCPFTRFQKITTEDAIPQDWCKECGNEEASFCASPILRQTKAELADERTLNDKLSKDHNFAVMLLTGISFIAVVSVIALVVLVLAIAASILVAILLTVLFFLRRRNYINLETAAK